MRGEKLSEEEKLVKILQVLNKIDSKLTRLDDIFSMLKMGQKLSIDQTKATLLGKSPLRKNIYNLCDGRHTVSDIAESLGKSMSLVSQSIAKLQNAGLIVEERKGKRKFYSRVV